MITFFDNIRSLWTRKDTVKQSILEYYLQDAKDFRYNFFVDFYHEKRPFSSCQGTCVDFNSEYIRLYLHSGMPAPPPIGLTANCFFVATKDKRKAIPCMFTSTVTQSMLRGQSIYIDVPQPDTFTHNQRRNNVRIPIKKDEIPDFKVYVGNPYVSLKGQTTTISWRTLELPTIELVDFSASGMKLHLSKNAEFSNLVSNQSLFLCQGNFNHDPEDTTKQLVIISDVRQLQNPENAPWMGVGLRFSRWAKNSDEKKQWIPTDESGVAALGSWLVPFMSRLKK